MPASTTPSAEAIKELLTIKVRHDILFRENGRLNVLQDKQTKEIADLRKALEPFAKAADLYHEEMRKPIRAGIETEADLRAAVLMRDEAAAEAMALYLAGLSHNVVSMARLVLGEPNTSTQKTQDDKP